MGVVAGLGGFVGQFYSAGTTIVLVFAILAVGATVVSVITDPPDRP